MSGVFKQIQGSCIWFEGHIWPKVYVYYTHLSIGLSDSFLSAIAHPSCSPKGLQFFSLRQPGSMHTWFPPREEEACFLTVSSALGFRESFVNFARLLKLPFLACYKDQVLTAETILNYLKQQRSLGSFHCCHQSAPRCVLSTAGKQLLSFLCQVQSLFINLVTCIIVNYGLFHFCI